MTASGYAAAHFVTDVSDVFVTPPVAVVVVTGVVANPPGSDVQPEGAPQWANCQPG